MTGAEIALVALLVAIGLSVVTRLNVGIVAIGLAWLVGVYAAGLTANEVTAAFPGSLLLTLAGVTLLFAVVEANGTLEQLTLRAVALARGDARWLPVFFFVVAGVVSSAGPGAISAVALLAPLGMAVAARTGITPFLMALMVANGANAGNLSPVSSIGVIANTKMAEAGLGGHEAKVFIANFAAHVLVATAGYLIFGGWRRRARLESTAIAEPAPLARAQRLTIVVVAAWMVAVIGFGLPLGPSAFVAASLLLAGRVADESAAIRRMPWAAILMVTGMSVLIGVVERAGGLDLFTDLLTRVATRESVNGVVALVTGAISTYSSTSGVVLPAFLPTVPGIVERLGGGDPLAIALSINVGSSLVDVSPLSTLGALAVAAVADPGEARLLFRRLLLWGLAMTMVGALLCLALAAPLARW